MAQAQLDQRNWEQGIITSTQWIPGANYIECTLDDTHKIVVKRTGRRINVLLHRGKKYISLPLHVFQSVCNLEVSVQLLATFLEGNRAQQPYY